MLHTDLKSKTWTDQPGRQMVALEDVKEFLITAYNAGMRDAQGNQWLNNWADFEAAEIHTKPLSLLRRAEDNHERI